MNSPSYWNHRYAQDDIPWDTGGITQPLRRLIDGLEDKDMRILIPGAGRGHEAKYLQDKGFRKVYVCDWAPLALKALRRTAPDFPADKLLQEDFFELDMKVELIIEQTFFCAIPRNMRPRYVEKTHALLSKEGQVAGLFFMREFPHEGPPHGGSEAEYRQLFEPFFMLQELYPAPDSIEPRLGSELFFRFQKKEV